LLSVDLSPTTIIATVPQWGDAIPPRRRHGVNGIVDRLGKIVFDESVITAAAAAAEELAIPRSR
jgi:hypothetical protein